MYRITLNRIHDRVRISEGDERLDLRVDDDPRRMMRGLTEAQRQMRGITVEATPERMRDMAMLFAGTIFGADQAAQLLEFYAGDASSVIDVCGRYFSERLSKLIAKAQKRMK